MKKILFIGAGIMGNWMIRNLMKAGYVITVYDIRREAVEALIQEGCAYYETLKECLVGQDAVITMVTTPKVVESLYFGPDAILENAAPGTYLIDMTTTAPSLEKRIYEVAKSKGLHFMDAPVTGGDHGARDAVLSILCGGDIEDFEACKDLFKPMGNSINYQGPIGSGQHTKMANQIMLAGVLSGIAESVAYAMSQNLDPDIYVKSVSTGAAENKQFYVNGKRMIDGDYTAGFFIKHFVKDLRITAEEAEAVGLDLDVTKKILGKYETIMDNGGAEYGMQALIKCYRDK